LSNLRCDLIDAGLLIATGIDGVVGHGVVFEDVLSGLNAAILRLGHGHGAETVRFPPVMNRSNLELNGYLKSFPQLATALHGFTCNDDGHATGEDQPTGLMLVPAACYPIYPMVAARGSLPADGALFNIQSWCFRREPSRDAARMQSFRMHEYVRLGTAEQVLAWRESWIAGGRSFFDSLQLPFRLEAANDPFFGRAGRLMASSQLERNLKVELLIPVTSDTEPTACCSFNYAENHFTEAWQIAMPDGSRAVSACVAFGMERITLALFRGHGLDPAHWPGGVRAVLFG
jgi:seryl-tRNA synthetase